MKAIHVQRTDLTLHPDRTRVLIRPFNLASGERIGKICAQVMALPESQVHTLLEEVQVEFGERHLKIREFLKRRFEQVRHYFLRNHRKLSEERELLLGRSEEHTSELQSQSNLVCRLLLEKKK